MVEFDKIDQMINGLSESFKNNDVYEHIVIDNFCDTAKLLDLYRDIPDPVKNKVNKSRDYIFAKNKYENSQYSKYGPLFEELYKDLTSERFEKQLNIITGEAVFMDKEFHGGGLHQGGIGSYLDMHTDFNYHPVHKNWFRNLNILLYLNKDWKQEYGGRLKLRHSVTGKMREIEPTFNRCVIMFTRDYTLHGYEPINFPLGEYRRSIAAYAYTEIETPVSAHSTTWYPENSNSIKQFIGKQWPHIVKIKNSVFGSATTKNK